ncbi:membrane integrity-associated transporter subunit PqiC [Marinomonas sp. M1K-6]|uniref:Membrane integrity-associated transporter subunit PqiC n=1 Tax=Marinomonas profundi TaxID=2726122 RepID=A0A847QVA5_9GAMM|nr:ABC-type transport auxiliary lipoprotein family protein [Marinomonas profundi]NLQ16758.1 membrane integrity-associated transporter subunit PqiC [Marinomonas profundi]UDV02492.1 membrane integrity-associated transporter subunit PqiC [Marinomonas profundi]
MKLVDRRTLLIVLMSWIMVGCAASSTPPSREYLLMDAGLRDVQAQTTEPISVQLMPIVVANYLTGNEIVLVTAQGEVYRSQNNLWAEPLSPQLTRLTLQRLEKALPDITWFAGQRLPAGAVALLNVEVDDFYADLDGVVHVSGRWQVISDSGELSASSTFDVKSELKSDGYGSMVQTLSASWFDQVMKPMIDGVVQVFND